MINNRLFNSVRRSIDAVTSTEENITRECTVARRTRIPSSEVTYLQCFCCSTSYGSTKKGMNGFSTIFITFRYQLMKPRALERKQTASSQTRCYCKCPVVDKSPQQLSKKACILPEATRRFLPPKTKYVHDSNRNHENYQIRLADKTNRTPAKNSGNTDIKNVTSSPRHER